MKRFFLLGFALLPFLFAGCDEDEIPVSDEELAIMQQYATDNGLDVSSTGSGILYEITQEGTGKNAKDNSYMQVNYTGSLMNGIVFDTSYEQVALDNGIFNPDRDYVPLEFRVGIGGFIRGWTQSMKLLNDGARATVIIPAYLAYGSGGVTGIIPPNSPIAFEVEVVELIR